jgi:gliding motility-associated-like protein
MRVLALQHRKWITFLVILLLIQGKLFAQLSAKFSFSPVEGCAPIVVHFTDQSTGNPTQWRWDLGNGVTSSLQHPSTTYFNPGTYTIKLVVRNAIGADSVVKNSIINVFPNPVINFKASDTSGCSPLFVHFTDLTTTAGGNLTNWVWDFGDGSTDNSNNPSHVYNTGGTYSVALKVSNSYGCTKTFSKNQYIQLSQGVQAGFTNSSPGQCKAPVTINFTNTSAGPGVLNYTWDFGDGTQSVEKDPVHTYTKTGSYTVTLISVSQQGCRDTVKKVNLISIGTINSNFTVPAGICEGQSFLLTNTTTPVPGSSLWNFGDGTTSAAIAPVKSYSGSGTYTIRLVNNFGGCSDSVSKTVTVLPKTKADFAASQNTSCKAPFTVNFINKTVGSNTYKWSFGDGSMSTSAQPSHTYTAVGTYTVTLIAVNENGCSDTLTKADFIQIQKPVITVNGLPRSGCNPVVISPSATITANEPVTGYWWDFGDGTTSNVANPTHTYTKAGNYDVTLTITTTNGCSESVVVSRAVRVGDKPQTKFTANPTDVCAFQPVSFTDNSTGYADQWLWHFGDGDISAKQSPAHEYQDTGRFSVTLIAWSNTCPDTLTINNMVYVRPPIASFVFTNNCADKYKKVFTDRSIGATSWFWNFGDGTTSSAQNPIHTYQAKGTYQVTLNVSNGNCVHSSTATVKVVDETPDFSADKKEICKDNTIAFSAQNINTANIARWQWNFGDGSTAFNQSSVAHRYPKTGKYTTSLTITDILGCSDTKKDEVSVYGPAADFYPNVPGACLENNNIQFADSSKGDGINALVKWVWNYGDGTVDANAQPPYRHSYAQTGEYTVSLKVTDSFGCADSLTKPKAVTIAQPKAGFHSPDSLSCTEKPVRFISGSNGYDLNYEWNFGDGVNSNLSNPVHNYQAIGLYSIRLKITDRYGCSDSVNKPQYINISLPKAAFTVSDSISSCPPLFVRFTNSSANYVSLKWNFGDGNISELANPSHSYTIPGIYYATLIVTGPGGCTDSMSKKIEVRGPRGSFSYKPPVGCKPLTVTFTATTLNRISFIWDFSDGYTISNKDSVMTHTYLEAGDYVPKMILMDASGCSVPIIGSDTIHVVGIEANIKSDKTRLCNSGSVQFTDATVSNDFITNWQWNFGDGNTSNQQHPAHEYAAPGSYSTQLIVSTINGCRDTASVNNDITVFEGPVISLSGDSAACMPAKFTFNGNVVKGDTNTITWNWTFGNGQTAALQHPSEQVYSRDGSYTVTAVATDKNGCTDTKLKTVTVYPLPNTNAGKDGLVCRDNTVQLHATGAGHYVWNASSSLNCLNCSDPVAFPTDNTVYVVTGFTQYGCSSADSVMIAVRQRFVMNVKPGDSVCAGDAILLWASGADKYTWYPSSGLDNNNIARPKARPYTTTTYTVIGKDNDNCFADTATVLLKVNQLPKVDAGADITLPVGSSVQLKTTSSADVTSWQWSPLYSLACGNCPDPQASPKQTTKYEVMVKNSGGCAGRDDVTVSVICNGGNLFIPNTFSPNGDGMNDRFYPRGTGIALIRSLRVFNRWGEVVFEKINFNANDAGSGWDGTYKGQSLSPDVYVYSCEVVCENNEVLPFKGDITLLK